MDFLVCFCFLVCFFVAVVVVVFLQSEVRYLICNVALNSVYTLTVSTPANMNSQMTVSTSLSLRDVLDSR